MTQPALRYLEPLLLMRNDHGRFTDVSARSGEPFKIPRAARGAAIADLNNDGYPDLVVSSLGQTAVVLENAAGGKHWFMVNTVGTRSNRDGFGARVRVVSQAVGEQYGVVSTAGSYLASSDKRVHFGLDGDDTVKLLEITWPSGTVQRLANIKADQVITVKEPAEAAEK
jgi:hypothetical protein